MNLMESREDIKVGPRLVYKRFTCMQASLETAFLYYKRQCIL